MVLRSDQVVKQLDSEFQRSYDSSFAWESLCSSYLALPVLRGFWPMSSIGGSGQAMETGSGANRLLTNVNTALALAWPQPAMYFQTGNSEYLYAVDASPYDILGTEAYVHTSYQGLTIGAWVYFDAIGQDHGLIGKWSVAAGNRSYLLYVSSGNIFTFLVSVNGTDIIQVTHTTTAAADQWYFVVGRYDPSTEVKIWVNDIAVINTTSIPAALHNGNADFQIGAYGTNGVSVDDYMEGKVSCGFLCAAMLPDNIIRRLYYRTRPAFQNKDEW